MKFNAKQISWSVLLLIIGIIIGFLYLQYRNKKSQFAYGEKPFGPLWENIGGTKGKELLANYYDEQDNIWPHYLRLRTGDEEEILRGFWIDKKMLDSIQHIVDTISSKPVIDGYSVFFGKWNENAKRYYSLVVRATRETKPTEAKYPKGVGSYFDMVDPCPDNCGDDDSKTNTPLK